MEEFTTIKKQGKDGNTIFAVTNKPTNATPMQECLRELEISIARNESLVKNLEERLSVIMTNEVEAREKGKREMPCCELCGKISDLSDRIIDTNRDLEEILERIVL